MKKLLPNLLFLYCTLCAVLVTASLFLTSNTGNLVIFTTLFLPVAGYFVVEAFTKLKSNSIEHESVKKSEIVILILGFIILTSISLYKIYYQKPVNQPFKSTPIVINKDVATPSPTPTPVIVKVVITDGVKEVNIRAKPTIYSEKIATTQQGQEFEMVQKSGEWYEIKLDATTSGFISFKYIAQ